MTINALPDGASEAEIMAAATTTNLQFAAQIYIVANKIYGDTPSTAQAAEMIECLLTAATTMMATIGLPKTAALEALEKNYEYVALNYDKILEA